MLSDKTVIELPYSTSFIKIKVPSKNLAFVLERKKTSTIDNEEAAIREALNSPVGSPALCKCLNSTDKVVILVTDNTRACPDKRLLPVILEEVESRVPGENITIIVALGLHPPLDSTALVQKLGRRIIADYRVINHDFNQTNNIGTTSRGNPVEIYREVAEADFILSTGFIEPHFFAGFSGGRKSIAPGVSSRRAICQNHSYKMIDDERARAGVLQGNPVHEDMVEQAKLAGLNFIVNVLLNKKGQITHVVAGDPVLAHEKGCRLEKNIATARISHEVDITIITNGGAPLDMDLYQTCKAIDTASQITRKGGIIIAVSRCNSGVGPEAFYRLHALSGSPQGVLERIQREEPIGVQWQNQILARSQLKNRVLLVSSLRPEEVRGMMLQPVSTVEEGIAAAVSTLGKEAEIAIIPEGPYVLPFTAKHEQNTANQEQNESGNE